NNLEKLGLDLTLNRAGSVMTLFFTEGPVKDFASAKKSDTEAFGRYFHAMLEEGIFLAPSQYEALFLSSAHTEEDIDCTVEASLGALRKAVG
ncbi:MAG: aspartate aminotransferase family protein, partial [Candidatus Glassbacteria bacterium]